MCLLFDIYFNISDPQMRVFCFFRVQCFFYLTFNGMPLTIRNTSFAFEATY